MAAPNTKKDQFDFTGHVGGDFIQGVQTFTRPNNVTKYAAGAVVSQGPTTALLKFDCASRIGNGGRGYIVKAQLWTDKKDWPSVMRVHLFTLSETGVAIPADAALMSTLYANAGAYLGSFDFAAMASEANAGSTAAYAQLQPLNFGYVCDANEQSIYAVLEDVTGSTPAALQNFQLVLSFERY